jgi:cation diffusion facilitator family transporter
MRRPTLTYPVLLSILAAVLTLGLKTVAYWLTGSVGLLSDALESIVNLTASVTAYLALWYAARPVDADHTYGHEKIEFFSSGIEGALVVVAAVGIAWVAVAHLFAPHDLVALNVGIAVAAAAAVINFAVARVLLRVGRARNSIVLEADGQHLMSDVVASAAVIVGVTLVGLTGYLPLDPMCALLMAGYVLWTGLDLVRRSFNGLMDHALPLTEQTAVRSAIESQLEPGITYHALRTRQAGARRFVDFHLLVPGIFSVQRAHDLTERIEEAIAACLPDIEVTVHIEPIEEPRAWEDSAMLPVEREVLGHDPPRSGEIRLPKADKG